MLKLIPIVILLLILQTVNAQTIVKQAKAVKTHATFTIDGKLNEEGWKQVTPLSDFVQIQPTFGIPERNQNRTEIYLLYDNNNIYVAGYCHESTIDSVSRELVGRDRIGINDFVGVIFDTYLDKINGTGFFTTPYGEQFDAKYSNNGEDGTWNGVWESAAEVVSDGWTFEMRIPYSAIRFSNKENQTWGLNIIRQRKKAGEKYFWNPVDPNINGMINQSGLWTGIEEIKPPLRLSFSPYFSTYVNHYPYKTPGVNDVTASFNGGMDIKYGINESFTLDMTLIPDFGQVQSDNKVLNLSPFEVQYNENRSFFTEGTELFSIGNLFYSRRIGSTPLHFYDVYGQIQGNETIIKNPVETKLFNATKISGRTSKGLGIGILNAITQPMNAVVEDDKGNRRNIETSPLTNYNIIVVNQTLKNNSSISLVNTNVSRKGDDYDANVSAFVFDLNNKKNNYGISGNVALSNIYGPSQPTSTGFMHQITFSKTSGRFVFDISQELINKKYDPNDMGILFTNNYLRHKLWMQYRWLQPTSWYKNLRLNFNVNYKRRLDPDSYQSFSMNVNGNALLHNLLSLGAEVSYSASGNDYYEPRVPGRVYKVPATYYTGGWISTNYAKRYYIDASAGIGFGSEMHQRSYEASVENSYRFSDKFSLSQETSWHLSSNEPGFADIVGNDVIFSRRDVTTIENSLNSKYVFNKRHGITFVLRHYWSEVRPSEFFTLQQDGTLAKNTTYNKNQNQNFNAFNIDMVYTWEFAPGSFLNIVWKNSIYDQNQTIKQGYFKNLNNTWSSPQNNNLSLKVIYYLDALKFRKSAT